MIAYARQAIVTKYLGPTNSKGARLKAYADAGVVTISWDHDLSPQENHTRSAKSLADKHGWLEPSYKQHMVCGVMPQSSEYAFCFVMVPNVAPVKAKKRKKVAK